MTLRPRIVLDFSPAAARGLREIVSGKVSPAHPGLPAVARPELDPVALELAQRNPATYETCRWLLSRLAGDVELAQTALNADTACPGAGSWVVNVEIDRLKAGGELRPGQSAERMESGLRRVWEAARAARAATSSRTTDGGVR